MTKEREDKLTRSFLGMLVACLLWMALDLCDTFIFRLEFNHSSKGLAFGVFVYVAFFSSIVLLFKNKRWLREVKPAVFCAIGYLVGIFFIIDLVTLISHLNITIVR